ncbi:secondary alcohol dehydrogenase [Stagonosporopsis vannaccii]|nr:secondary alcohol dehydrogenase [Stagonosporopsis vannaccii]
MSAESRPITAARFAAALNELPISSLYAKHSELFNNITHLESSNKQLEDFARENDDRDCYEALLENRQVMKNFNERMELIRKEVEEVRGLPWRPRDEREVRKEEGAVGLNGTTPTQNETIPAAQTGSQGLQEQTNGTSAQTGEDEEGVYL